MISGSCSVATNAQVEHFIQAGGYARMLDAVELERNGGEQVEKAIAWADALWDRDPNADFARVFHCAASRR